MKNNEIYLIGTDIGTLGTKSLVINGDGEIISSDYREYGVLTPKPLWAEQWPDIWFVAVCKTIKNSLEKAKINTEKVLGITISGLYGGSGIPCDEDVEAIRPCIIWMDRRATNEVNWVKETIGEDKVFEITANYIDSYHGFTKILWIKNNEPEVWKKIKYLVTPYAYAIYHLTGELSLDLCSAGNIGGIFDMKKRDMSNELLKEMDIPRDFFPEELVDSSHIVGKINSKGAELTGLLNGTPVCAGGVDCVVATLGTGAFNEGDHVAIIGTSSSWGIIHDGKKFDKSLISMPHVAYSKEKAYSFAGSATSGAIIQWFREQFGAIEKIMGNQLGQSPYSLLDQQAEKIPPGSDKLVVLPYFMGERAPIWDVNARGTVFGLTLYHTKAHLYRAFLEAVAYALRTCTENGKKLDMKINKNMIMAGGATKSKLWKQIFADITQFPLVCVSGGGEAPYGGALLAAVGVGHAKDFNIVNEWNRYEKVVEPISSNVKIYDKYFKEYKLLYESLGEPIEKLKTLE